MKNALVGTTIKPASNPSKMGRSFRILFGIGEMRDHVITFPTSPIPRVQTETKMASCRILADAPAIDLSVRNSRTQLRYNRRAIVPDLILVAVHVHRNDTAFI